MGRERLQLQLEHERGGGRTHVDDCMDRLSLQSHFNLTYRMMCASQREVFGIVYDFELE